MKIIILKNAQFNLFKMSSNILSLTDDIIQFNIASFVDTKILGKFSEINRKFNILSKIELQKRKDNWLWDKVTHETIIDLIEFKEDWSRTKYYKQARVNRPLNYFYNNEERGNWKTIPGIIANIIFTERNIEFDFKQEYNDDKIFEISGGILLNVKKKTNNTISVTYIPYDHHNEPIYSDTFTILKL